jgi:hypothetical protein
MAKRLEHLRSKRYWALILLGPPLRVVFAYSAFAGLHLGLGLPWPTLEGLGPAISLLEFLSLLVLQVVMDRLVLGGIYGVNVFQRAWWSGKLTVDVTGSVVAILMTLAGHVAIMFAGIEPLKVILTNDGSGAGLVGYLVVTSIFYASTVIDGERARQGGADVTTKQAGA